MNASYPAVFFAYSYYFLNKEFPMEPFIKLKDVSRLTGIPTVTLRRWILDNKGPAFKRSPTGTFLFHKSEVERWAESLDGPTDSTPDQL
jgi:hypothetical protein